MAAWCAAGVLLAATPHHRQDNSPPPAPALDPAGEAIYRFGRLPSGKPLTGERDGGLQVSGADAACVNCHRRSGLGAAEGRGFIPPITGQYLFHQKNDNRTDRDLPYVEGARPNRTPYTSETLARVIRSGVDSDGRALSMLMPRFALDDASMSALTAYLRELATTRVPGVSDGLLHFATIVTPDADPVKRDAMLAVLDDFFAEKNASARAVSPRMYSYRKQMFKVTRHWQLHVWTLTGPATSWEAQLQKHLAAEPVFAAISGIGGKNWAPVHHFCEHAQLPCLFPNAQLPVVAEDDFHNLYFSKGVLLEAALVAHDIDAARDTQRLHRLVQVFRADDIGADASRTLQSSISHSGVRFEAVALRKGLAAPQVAEALRGLGDSDALMLWLRPKDLAEITGLPVPVGAHVWMSGLMGGLEQAPLASSWRGTTRVAYPFDLPDRRRIRVDYPLGWFRIRHVPVTDLQTQADTYLACGLLSETLNHMVDTFVPDYLVERMEEMLEHRVITGYYPHLALAPGQRFASKGGYVVQFAEPTGTKVVAIGDWIVP
jgi:hypothetical protein